MKYNKDTSEKILDNAFSEFEERGYSGARMQSIADRAGINKALLHYYYKSKDALFELIIKKAFNMLLPKIFKIFDDDANIFELIENFVSVYIDIIIKHPHIPGFVIHEISNNPNRLLKLVEHENININNIKQRINQEMENGTIIKMPVEQLITNVISLCVFPFVAKPLLTGLVLNGDKKAFDAFVEQRKTEVSKFVINAIKIN